MFQTTEKPKLIVTPVEQMIKEKHKTDHYMLLISGAFEFPGEKKKLTIYR